MSKNRCASCRCTFVPIRNPNQRYCSKKACQNARKEQWRKHKHRTDPAYQEHKRRAQKKWRRKSPQYWRNYRNANTHYTQKNRQKQRIRDHHRAKSSQKDNGSHLAKSDALTSNSLIKSGVYTLIPGSLPTLAKSDALTVKISLIT
jgi:hypothetical protein